MKNRSKTMLLFNLSDAEIRLARRLSSPLGIETVVLSTGNFNKFNRIFHEKDICCIVYHIEETRKRPQGVIKQIRNTVGDLVPLLLLVPKQKSGEIKKYITAGADDFLQLPLNEKGFSSSFNLLVAIGQSPPRLPSQKTLKNVRRTTKNGPVSGRGSNYIEAGLKCFAKKSFALLKNQKLIAQKWQKVQKLGFGASGVVWLVKDIRSGQLAVAKVPHSVHQNIRVLRSAAVMKRLGHHPNLAYLLEIVKDRGKFILIQEYAKGATLQQLLQQRTSLEKKERYLQQLLSAISYCHKHKIIHRDIKPENIIITQTGQLKLIDFGIARDLSWQTGDGTSEGTVNFMPPEQFKGQCCLASDVWALGVILYIFATNTVPFALQNDHYPMDIESTATNMAPSKVSPLIHSDLERIIMTCLQKDQKSRYNNAGKLLDDLEVTFPGFARGETATTTIGYGLVIPSGKQHVETHWEVEQYNGFFGVQPAHA